MSKHIGAPFVIRLVLYIVVLALSITSLASDKWGSVDFKVGSIGGITFGTKNNDFSTPLKLSGDDEVGKKSGTNMPQPSWMHTVFGLMVAGTVLQGVGFILNLCDLSQKNDYLVLSGYVLAFIGSVLVITAASEWIDRIKTYEKDFKSAIGTVTKMIDDQMNSKLDVTSTWAPPLALASGVLGAVAAVVGFSLEMHNRLNNHTSDQNKLSDPKKNHKE